MKQQLKRIVIVDDDKLNRTLLTLTLAKEGYEDIKDFECAEDAVTFIQSDTYLGVTLFLVDIQMPVMDGFEFAKEIEKLDEEKRVNYRLYLMTSSTFKNTNEKIAEHWSVINCLTKPITPGILQTLKW